MNKLFPASAGICWHILLVAVAGMVIVSTGIFVSTTGGRDYFVADHSGRFSGLER